MKEMFKRDMLRLIKRYIEWETMGVPKGSEVKAAEILEVIDSIRPLYEHDMEKPKTSDSGSTIPCVVGSALLKDLLDGSEEVITINGLRFTGTHEEKVKQVFEKHGIKYETPF